MLFFNTASSNTFIDLINDNIKHKRYTRKNCQLKYKFLNHLLESSKNNVLSFASSKYPRFITQYSLPRVQAKCLQNFILFTYFLAYGCNT